MGGALERYYIDMQETQHLDHLSAALHLLRPPMKTFLVKHHAYNFQVAITIVCHKAVDPSVVTQPPAILTSEMIAVYAADATPPLGDINRQLKKLHRGIRIERIGVGILPFPRPPVDIMAARPFTR